MNIARFINSSRLSLFYGNCSFEEHFNDQELFMKTKASIFVVVHVIHSFSLGDELLINYNFHGTPTARSRHLALDYP